MLTNLFILEISIQYIKDWYKHHKLLSILLIIVLVLIIYLFLKNLSLSYSKNEQQIGIGKYFLIYMSNIEISAI